MQQTLIFSESFIDFLGNISDESKIARLILSCRRARRDGFYYLYNAVLKMDEVNYITYRNNGLMSYMPADRVQETNDDGSWKREGRQEGKPARVMRRIFTKSALKCLKDSDFEIFNNKYKSQYSTSDFTFEVLPASSIPDVYCMEQMSGGASLGNSCMNGDRDYLDIYKNCNKLEIIVLKNAQGLLAGRALLWTLEYEEKEIKLADRFYVAEDHMYDALLTYVESNKWWRKDSYKTYSYKQTFIDGDGNNVITTFVVETPTDFDLYPYIDTFSYGGEGWLTNSSERNHTYVYNQTDGYREGGGIYDEINECMISLEDSITIERGQRRGVTTHVDNTVVVDERVWWIKDDDIRCINDKYYHSDDVVYSDYDGEDHLECDCVYSEHHETFILRSEAYRVAGNYYHEDVVERA